tara:strand:+ start:13844 stop:18328 length:4485 start_codon:yes stop_codon:yes gene_type:complete
MSRRYVKTSKFDSLDKVVVETTAVISAKDNLQGVKGEQTYFKRNYLDAIRQIIPKFYFNDEQQVSGVQVSYPNQLINSHILANKNQATIFPVSALVYDTYLSSINTPEGFSKYFIKRNTPAQISPDDFQRNILYPLNQSFSNYKTSASFIDYVSGTFLPSIPALATGHHATENLATLTASAFSNDSSGTYKYLANNLGWLYFLNRSGPAGGFDPSSALATLITDTLWKGRSIVLEDTINIYQEHLWRNEGAFSLKDKVVPPHYASSLGISAAPYTSGTQLLDRLKTLNTVVYSPHFLNSPDKLVEDSFSTYFGTSTTAKDGSLITTTEEAGPLTRFLEAMSFCISDRLTEQNEIGVLYDIGRCPDEFLELLAELIGWRFIGADIDKWRVQLRNAVKLYKQKGTKGSIQYLLDTLFSTGVLNVTTSDTLTELYESYIPDLIYYSLATSSEAFSNFETYTPELAAELGITSYSYTDMDRNIKLVVDKILFDLVREFPDNFKLNAKPFPQIKLATKEAIQTAEYTAKPVESYLGPYYIEPNTVQAQIGSDVPGEGFPVPKFMTGSVGDKDSEELSVFFDPNFSFFYRNRAYLIPPYEKRKYYTQTEVTTNMIERIEYYLRCYGVDKSFAASVKKYITEQNSTIIDVTKVLNNFLMFTRTKHYPDNYGVILKNVTKQKVGPDPVSLLSLWNGKSSNFMMRFNASSFDWASQQMVPTAKYGLTKILRVIDQVVPAHAIPNVFLTVSDVADTMNSISTLTCQELRPNFNNVYEGSSNVTTNFATCCVDMEAVAIANGLPAKHFNRVNVDSLADVMMSATTFIAVPRNSLRRRNYHSLLPENRMFTRLGRNNPGSLELSTSYYSSSIGYVPLGYIPSSLKFQNVSIRQNDVGYGLGTLLDHKNIHPVWEQCQNLISPSSIFGYDVSNTFASRAKQNIPTSSCNTYGRRGDLSKILMVMNKVHDQEKYLQASSMVSGYYDSYGYVNTLWPTGSDLITPMNFSSWYYQAAITDGLNVPFSIGNHLINKESSDESLNYYEHFTFGNPVYTLFNTYNNLYGSHTLVNFFELLGGPNIINHTYGPLIYNSDFNIDGSSLGVSSFLAASSPITEVDISYNGGTGILSPSGASASIYNVGSVAASDTSDVYLKYPEFRNSNLVSSIELVDTSAPFNSTKYLGHPIFSIFNLTRDAQTKYSFSKYLINNQLIKYHRSSNSDLLPRIKIKIDNSDTSNKARNFLEVDHEYEVTVKAHNLSTDGKTFGKSRLGLWVHTEPESEVVWSYNDDGQWTWRKISDFAGSNGINIARNLAQQIKFKSGKVVSFNSLAPLVENCYEPLTTPLLLIPGSSPQAIANLGESSRESITFKFSTFNKNVHGLKAITGNNYDKVHRTDQKYALEFFDLHGHNDRFIVFESIEIKDITNYNKAVITTKYGDVRLDPSDLKTVFRFFKTLSTGIAGRNSTVTSGVMDVSGGSRLNYRSNTYMYDRNPAGTDAYGVLSSLDIIEG